MIGSESRLVTIYGWVASCLKGLSVHCTSHLKMFVQDWVVVLVRWGKIQSHHGSPRGLEHVQGGHSVLHVRCPGASALRSGPFLSRPGTRRQLCGCQCGCRWRSWTLRCLSYWNNCRKLNKGEEDGCRELKFFFFVNLHLLFIQYTVKNYCILCKWSLLFRGLLFMLQSFSGKHIDS